MRLIGTSLTGIRYEAGNVPPRVMAFLGEATRKDFVPFDE
jgi:hypothetical protein